MIKDELEQKSLVAFGSLFEIKNGLNKEKEAFGHGNYIVNYMDVNKNTRLNSTDISGLVNTTDTECARFEVKENDLFFTRTSESSEEIGLTAAIESVLPKTVFSGFILRARPLTELSSSYYAYMLRTYTYRKEIIKHSSITTRALTSGSLLASMKIPSTSYNKQITITNYLSQIDNLIRTTDSILLAYKASKESVLSIYFNYKNLNTAKISYLADIKKGMQLNKDTMVATGKYKVFNGGINYSGLTNTYNESSSIIISEGGNSCGYIQYIDSKFWLGGHCYSVKINSDIHQKYFYYNLKYNESNIQKLRVGSGLPNIQKKDILNYQLNYHETKLQPIIANTLSQMDNLVDKRKVLSILVFINQDLINDFFSYISDLLFITLK